MWKEVVIILLWILGVISVLLKERIAMRHVYRASRLLTQAEAQAAKDPDTAKALAGSAAAEADKAMLLLPWATEFHFLKGSALHLQGFHASALKSLNTALTSRTWLDVCWTPADALLRRAQVMIELSQAEPEWVDSAIDDLVESIGLRANNARAQCLLGECFEKKGLVQIARMAFEEAKRVDPENALAQEGIRRLDECNIC